MRSRVKWSDSLRDVLNSASTSTHTLPSTSESDSSNSALEPRPMSDSYCELLLPFASSPDLLETYTNTSGGIRTGMLMEHLDSLAGSIAYKHVLGPGVDATWVHEKGFYIVTASVDRRVPSFTFCPDTYLTLVRYTGLTCSRRCTPYATYA